MNTIYWRHHGSLSEIASNNNSGVYLLVFSGKPKRIIYVGTSNCFNRRFYQHKIALEIGGRTSMVS